MNTRSLLRAAVLIVIGMAGHAAAAAPPAAGDQLAAIRLAAPADAEVRAHLGLTADGAFDPTTIRGSLLIIKIFSVYCPHCQREAPAVNRLYQAIAASDGLGDGVKMIGIGVGNSPLEINPFRKRYQIEFPLFPDADFVIHQQLGEVHTPFFIIVRLDAEDRGRILWTGAGSLDPLETFLNRLDRLLQGG